MRKLIVAMAMFAPLSFVQAQDAPAAATPPAAAPAAAPATQQLAPTEVVLQVGEEKMTLADYNNFIESLPEQVREAARGEARRMLADRLVEIKLLAQEAERRGLTKQPKVEMALEMAREQALAQLMAEAASSEADDAALRAEYDKNKAQYEQVHARHVLIRTEDSPAPATPGKASLNDADAQKKAQEVRARLVDKKEDFAAVAKAESDDTGSAARGGDLGFFSRGRMVAAFEDAAFTLKPGEVSEPVKSAFGYHVIEVLERKTPTFEEMKPQLAAQGGGERVEKLLKSLKESQKVVVNDQFFGPEQQAPVMPPMPPAP